MFENKVVRTNGHKRDEFGLTGGWSSLYHSPYDIRMIKSRIMAWAEYVVYMD
jgi:hypothetical protein